MSQVCGSSEKPTVAKFSLSNVKARESIDEEPWTVANLFRAEPFENSVRVTQLQALIGGWKFRIFKQRPGVEALLTQNVKVLNFFLLHLQAARLFTKLQFKVGTD